MHEVWYGKRYNELVDGFNDIIPVLNDLLTYQCVDALFHSLILGNIMKLHYLIYWDSLENYLLDIIQ